MRKLYPMNKDWYFKSFEEKHVNHLDLNTFEKVMIPHNAVDIPYNNFNEADLWGIFTYVKEIEIKEDMVSKHVVLRFEGVAHEAKVYVNQDHVLTHEGGYIPFEVDLSSYASEVRTLSVLVVVNTQELSHIPPFGGVVDYLGYGGIYREVSLICTDVAYITNVFIEQYGKPQFKVHVNTSIEGGHLKVEIFDRDEKLVFTADDDVRGEHTIFPIQIEELNLWDIDHPYLYTAKLTYTHGSELDEVEQRFGLREAIFKRDGFYLNQRRVTLQGLNHHQSYPYVGYAMPKRAQIEDADLIKFDLGCNIVRTSHYPQSIHFLNRCDEIGLLVLEEIPGWQHIGDEAWQKASLENLDVMIERDRNHPSIILWGVRINESPDNDTFYQKMNAHAMALDPTRQRGGVRNFAKSHFFEDVYTYNDFSHTGQNKGLEKKEKISGDVPYLVTEFNGHMYPTKRFDDEIHRVNHLKRHLRVLNDAYNEKNRVAGAIGWVFADYNTHKEFGSGDKICYHGVLDMYRIPKIASLAYRAQQEKEPVLEVTSTMNLGDHPAGQLDDIFVITNLDEVKVYKNDVYIKTYKPDLKMYPHLPHPPIIVDDLIGETLQKNEKMSFKDAELTKSVLRAVTVYGNHLPLSYKLKMLYIFKKYKRDYNDAVRMFYTYMTGWGTKHNAYKFEGYKQGVKVKEVIKEPVMKTDLIIEHNGADLLIDETYDTKRYVIKMVDQNQEILPYAFDPLTLEVEGGIELIGPSQISLLGGAIAFWVKSLHKGIGKITVKHEQFTLIEEVNVDETNA